MAHGARLYDARMAEDRLQKILARGGLASRRAAEQLILDGKVRVNGKVVTELGTKADPRTDKIEVDGKPVIAEHPMYFALHKPRGFVTTMNDPEGRPSIKDLLRPHGISARVFPVGRLDYNTSGIILLTNDGEFADGLLHPKRAVPKTYVVKVQGPMEPKDLDKWREGIQLEDGMTAPAEAFFLRHEGDKTWFQVTIKEGRNQQVRRMGEATGFRVMRLARIAFAGITSEDIKPGDLRPLGYNELVELKKNFGVPRKPAIALAPIPGFERKPRAGVAARRIAWREREDRRAEVAGDAQRTERPRLDKGAAEADRAAPKRTGKKPTKRDPFADFPTIRGPAPKGAHGGTPTKGRASRGKAAKGGAEAGRPEPKRGARPEAKRGARPEPKRGGRREGRASGAGDSRAPKRPR